MYNFPTVLTVFRRFFPWIVQGDVDLCFLLILVTKPNAVDGDLHQLRDYITNIINPHM